MLSAIAIVPSAPVMVDELAPGTDSELADLRAAVTEAAASLPARWVVVGTGRADDVVHPRRSGTFAGYGVDVPVALSPDAPTGAPAPLPLCALIAGWLRGRVNPRAHAEVRVYADGHGAEEAVGRGRRLRADLDAVADPVGVLVVADGAHTLSQSAPGGYQPHDLPVQEALDDALARGDAATLTRQPDAVLGRVAYQVLAGLVDPAPSSAGELYRGAPYGVGYFVGVWQP
ncbi:hypothetical protein [Mycolicibacterium sp. XJ1819]